MERDRVASLSYVTIERMSHKKLIIGNWKMYPSSVRVAKTEFVSIKKAVQSYKNVEAVIATPAVYLYELSKYSGAGLSLAGQNVSAEKEGAYTGEVSASMLGGAKVKYCIVGHSERRALGETDAFINKKIRQLLSAKITPVLCVGERERDGDMWYLSIVNTQLKECLEGLPKSAIGKIVIAYEPVWAISTSENRRDATPADFEEMRIYIQKVLADTFGISPAHGPRILYGGSVDEKNAGSFLRAGADGLLPGKASRTPKKFIKIIELANEISKKS